MVSLSPGKRVRPRAEPAEPLVVPWTAPAPPHELIGGVRGRRNCALLDSAADQSGQGAWTILAVDPVHVLTVPPPRLSPDGGATTGPDPFAGVGRLLALRLVHPHAEIPFTGGAIGAWGYDLRCRLETRLRRARSAGTLPSAWIGIYDSAYLFDTRSRRGFLVRAPAAGERRNDARQSLERLRAILEAAAASPPPPSCAPAVAIRSSFTPVGYAAAVRRVQEYIAAGDIYQANLSQQFTASSSLPPAALYRHLRDSTPAPFAAFIDAGAFQILSASPECFLQIRNREVITRPIKGTRPRSADPDQDARLAEELLGSEKDRSELVMIVDLERNDLGKVCEYGSVRVPRLCELESHPTVHHLVATVAGRLREDVSALAALHACFPGGSVTGAPKIRAMEILDELEPARRGFYTGAIGYAGFDGSAQWNIAIRTMVTTGRAVTFSAGGAIVADSDPAAEYEETLHKARAMFRALELSSGC